MYLQYVDLINKHISERKDIPPPPGFEPYRPRLTGSELQDQEGAACTCPVIMYIY